MSGLKDWKQAHSLVWFIPPWTIRTWGFLQQRAVCIVHCIECTLMLQKIITKEVGAGCPCCYFRALVVILELSRYFYIFYKLLYMLAKHWSLAHWNLPWQNQITLTYKLFFTKRKKILSKCIPLRVQSLLPSQPTPTDGGTECPGRWFVGGLLPRALTIAKLKHQPGAALCLQNKGITFVPNFLKKLFTDLLLVLSQEGISPSMI